MKTRQNLLRNDEGGAVAALYALALPVLVAMAGIGFDYARIASLDTELQNAADQAALAGATQLNQNPNSIVRATAAAQGGLVANSTLFANDGSGQGVSIPNTGVFFYQTRTDAESGTNAIDTTAAGADAKAKFIRVKVAARTANYALTPVVGAFSGTIDAEAVAGIGAALCRTPPLMICNPDEPASNTNKDYDYNVNSHKGQGLLAKGGSGSKWAPGDFGYLDVFGGGGDPEIKKAMGWTSSPGNCISQSGNLTVDMAPGNHADVADAINTRFDIYNGNLSTTCLPGGSCPASINSTKDLVHSADFTSSKACWTDSSGWHEPSSDLYRPTDPSNPLPSTTTPSAMGYPRDLCHAVSENGSCTPNTVFGTGKWDWDAYFRVNYGATWDWRANTAAGTKPLPIQTNGGPTRFDVYKWEIDNRDTTVAGKLILGERLVGADKSYGSAICSAKKGFSAGVVPNDTTADRRRLSVAVVNCQANGVKGNASGVPVRRWMDVFLVEPSVDRSGNRTRKDQIYVEIIGETTAGSAGETAGTVIRRDVPFLIK